MQKKQQKPNLGFPNGQTVSLVVALVDAAVVSHACLSVPPGITIEGIYLTQGFSMQGPTDHYQKLPNVRKKKDGFDHSHASTQARAPFCFSYSPVCCRLSALSLGAPTHSGHDMSLRLSGSPSQMYMQ